MTLRRSQTPEFIISVGMYIFLLFFVFLHLCILFAVQTYKNTYSAVYRIKIVGLSSLDELIIYP